MREAVVVSKLLCWLKGHDIDADIVGRFCRRDCGWYQSYSGDPFPGLPQPAEPPTQPKYDMGGRTYDNRP